jgi:hypothetical protein
MVCKTVTTIRALGLGALLLCSQGAHGQVQRGRSEAGLWQDAANVMGSGNITAFSRLSATYGSSGGSLSPIIGGQIGVGGIMEFRAQAAFQHFRQFGPLEAHLQLTLPGNDQLRLFNGGVRGDLYLSTTQDTISLTTDAEKPEYSPFFGISVVGDIDWLARFKSFPFKTALAMSLVDDAEQLHRYNQLAISTALEWKQYRHALFLEGGTALYREKPNRLNPLGDDSYEQYYVWLAPGGRYRLADRFSLSGSLRITLYEKLKAIPATRTDLRLNPPTAAVALRIEVPLFFQETNTEAIRSLVFMEQRKEQDKNELTNLPGRSRARSLIEDLSLPPQEGQEDGGIDEQPDVDKLIERREELQQKMDEIERLLKDTE